MKLIHLSDLHLGKRLCEYSMLEDQAYILEQIITVIDGERPDGVLIAGDIYDKPVPPTEAVQLFDGFLSRLAERHVQVFVISGNHDSPERLSFGSRLMDAGGIHLSPVYDGTVSPITLHDAYGNVNIYMLPFLRPAHIRRYYGEEGVDSYTDAMRCAIAHMNVDTVARNVLITHQFVTDAVRTESEDVSVGGADNVDADVFLPFDYVALGHLHAPQDCGSEKIRYCGTPLKYSFSEAEDQKSVTVVELAEKGNLSVRTVDLVPLHDLVELRGTYAELTLKSFYENTTWQEDYTHLTLTDEEDIPDAIGKLRVVYRRLMKLDYDNRRTRSSAAFDNAADVERRTPFELFSDFYQMRNNQPMTAEQAAFMENLIEQTWEDRK